MRPGQTFTVIQTTQWLNINFNHVRESLNLCRSLHTMCITVQSVPFLTETQITHENNNTNIQLTTDIRPVVFHTVHA